MAGYGSIDRMVPLIVIGTVRLRPQPMATVGAFPFAPLKDNKPTEKKRPHPNLKRQAFIPAMDYFDADTDTLASWNDRLSFRALSRTVSSLTIGVSTTMHRVIALVAITGAAEIIGYVAASACLGLRGLVIRLTPSRAFLFSEAGLDNRH
jgi:hypothetical protein